MFYFHFSKAKEFHCSLHQSHAHKWSFFTRSTNLLFSLNSPKYHFIGDWEILRWANHGFKVVNIRSLRWIWVLDLAGWRHCLTTEVRHSHSKVGHFIHQNRTGKGSKRFWLLMFWSVQIFPQETDWEWTLSNPQLDSHRWKRSHVRMSGPYFVGWDNLFQSSSYRCVSVSYRTVCWWPCRYCSRPIFSVWLLSYLLYI